MAGKAGALKQWNHHEPRPDDDRAARKTRDHQWHWARHEGDDLWFVFEAKDGRMWNGPRHMSAETAYQYGWRYAGPAQPPGAAARPKTGIPMADMADDEWEAFIHKRGPQDSQPRSA